MYVTFIKHTGQVKSINKLYFSNIIMKLIKLFIHLTTLFDQHPKKEVTIEIAS